MRVHVLGIRHHGPGSARSVLAELDRLQPAAVVIEGPADADALAGLVTAEAISVLTNGIALAAHFGDGTLRAGDVAAGIVGAVVKDPVSDGVVWREYLETVVRERTDWIDFYRAARDA